MRVLVFAGETGRVKSNCARPASSASRGDNEVDHAVCLKAEFLMHTALSNENGKFYTTMIYPCFSRLVCFSMGSPASWRFGVCSSGSSLVSRWRDAPLVHAPISNVTSQMLINRSALISGASNVFLVNVINYCRENSSWYIRSDYLVQQLFHQSPSASYFQQFTGSCYSLWITGNGLWHRDKPSHAADRCHLYFQGKYIFYVLINIFFLN